MDLNIEFDALDFQLEDMGDHHLLSFWNGPLMTVILFEDREWIQDVFAEMVNESGKPEVSFGEDFKPTDPGVLGNILTVNIAYCGFQVFGPTKDEPYWCLYFDDEDSSSQVGIRFGNDLSRQLIARLAKAKGPHQHNWVRVRIYMGVDHQPSAEELEECRTIASNPEASFPDMRAVLTKLGCQVIIGGGPDLPMDFISKSKGILIADFDFCNCGARRKGSV